MQKIPHISDTGDAFEITSDQSTMKALISSIKSAASSADAWTDSSSCFVRSKLKMPIMDLASTTYLPEVRSMSNFDALAYPTNSFTCSIELRLILHVAIIFSFSAGEPSVVPGFCCSILWEICSPYK